MTTCRSTSTSGSKSVLTFALPPISSMPSTIRTTYRLTQAVVSKTWDSKCSTQTVACSHDSYNSLFARNFSVAFFLDVGRSTCTNTGATLPLPTQQDKYPRPLKGEYSQR